MGFGSFLVNAGNAYIGAADQAEKLARLRQQQMINDKHAAEIRARREQEVSDEAIRKAKQAELQSRVTASIPNAANTREFDYTGAVPSVGANPPALTPGERQVSPSNIPSIHIGGRNPNTTAPTEAELTANIAAGKAKLDRLKSNPTNQVKLDRDAAAGWGAAAKDMGNMFLDANPITATTRAIKGTEGPLLSNIINPAKNLINRGANAVIGEPTYRTDFPTGKPINPNALKWRKEDLVPEISATKREIAKQEAQLKKLKETPVTKPAAKTVVAESGGKTSTATLPDGTPFSKVIETLENSRRNQVSPTGAKSEMQVLDSTNRDPGFGVTPARDNSLEERARVGRDYANVMLNRYGDPKLAATAYQFGPGNTDKWIANGANEAALPEETKRYRARYDKLTGNGAIFTGGDTSVAQQTPSAVSVTPGLQKVSDTAIPNGTRFSTGAERELPAAQDPTGEYYDAQIRTAESLIKYGATASQVIQGEQALYQAKIAKYEHQVSTLSNAAASGNSEALGHMVAMYNRINGTNYGYAALSDGRVALATPEGRVVAPPSDPKLISRSLLEGISPAIRQIAASTAQEYSKAFATESGKQAASGPWEAKKENLKAQTEIYKSLINSKTEIYRAMQNTYNSGKPSVVADSINGGVYVVTPDGVLYQGPNIDVEGVSTAPALRPIASTQEMLQLLQ